MTRSTFPNLALFASAGLLIALAACSDGTAPTAVAPGTPSTTAGAGGMGGSAQSADRIGQAERLARRHRDFFFAMLDDCDSATFNAPTAAGPGACVHDGRTTFQRFIAELQATQNARRWRFEPRVAEVRAGATLVAANLGGEVHTFTTVKRFGGGLVPKLNLLAGTPNVAPECLALETDDFVNPGSVYEVPTARAPRRNGAVHDQHLKIQCCIHPWMRARVELEHGG